MRAIISIYDKTGIVDFARRLVESGVELISTGGTYRVLSEDGGLPVRQVSDVTGSPEILDGRVKTLHPRIHGGLLARRNDPEHMKELEEQSIQPFDLVVVNLYPFIETVRKPGVGLDEALENIDIGGPTLLRAGAKNFSSVAVVVDSADYSWVADRIAGNGLSFQERQHLAFKAFQHVSTYDTAVAGYLGAKQQGADGDASGEMPQMLELSYRKHQELRYGENPHQKAALYVAQGTDGGVAKANQLHGRELSFNNLLDADAAWRAATDFQGVAVAIIKHTNPCGLAVSSDQVEAYQRALAGDPVSAFGGIVGFNSVVTADTAREISSVFYEVVVAPGYEDEALEELKKKRNLRILEAALSRGGDADYDLRPLSGGLLAQSQDLLAEDESSWQVVTKRKPSDREMLDLAFAWKVAKHVKSNAIVLVKDQALVGMGAGQPNRINSVHLAVRAAGEMAPGSVLASDAFFPFPDGLQLAADGGATGVVQPGGSIRDDEVIAAADNAGLAMVFTGVRHFKH